MGTQACIIALRAVIRVMQCVVILRIACEFMVIKRDLKPFQFLVAISEPLFEPIRKVLTKQTKDKKMRFDISPFVVLVLLNIVHSILKRF
jgi:uncharacterized protein YggT (Ycf19 family)